MPYGRGKDVDRLSGGATEQVCSHYCVTLLAYDHQGEFQGGTNTGLVN